MRKNKSQSNMPLMCVQTVMIVEMVMVVSGITQSMGSGQP